MSFVPPVDKKDAKRKLAKILKTLSTLNAEKRDAADAGYELGVKAIDEKIRELKLHDASEFYASFLDDDNEQDTADTEVTSTKLTLDDGAVNDEFSEKLRSAKLSSKNDGTFSKAIISAGHYAKKLNKTIYVYSGNSW